MATSDVATRIELYVAMGKVYESELKEVDRAIEAYNDVLSFDGDEERALDALGRLYEKISEWDRAIDMMAHLVQLTRTRAARSICTGGWARSSTPSSVMPRRAEATCSAVSPRSPATCRRWRPSPSSTRIAVTGSRPPR